MTTQNIPRAVAAIVFAVFALSFGDAVIKAINVSLPIWQMFFLRSALVLPVLAVMLLREPSTNWWPVSPLWALVRSLLLVLMWLIYYIALPHVPFATAAAGFYTLPLFIAMLSPMFTNQPMGAKGWIAVLFGFAGVLVLLRPDTSGFNAYALLPLLSALLYAFAMLMTGTKCRSDSPLTLVIVLNVVYVVIGGLVSVSLIFVPQSGDPFLWQGWVAMSSTQMLALLVLAAAIFIGGYFTVIAYQSAPAVTVSSFDYSYLAFAFIWGLLFFNERPDTASLIGIAMIFGAGMIALRR